MSKNRVQEISDRFVKTALESFERYMMGDNTGGRRANVRGDTYYCQLRDLGEEGLAELRRLMSHSNMAVRLGAAGRYRWVDRYEGLKVIQEVARGCDDYPVGSIERKVSFAASAVFNLSTMENPPGVDPYIAWQEEKAKKATPQS